MTHATAILNAPEGLGGKPPGVRVPTDDVIDEHYSFGTQSSIDAELAAAEGTVCDAQGADCAQA